MNYFELGALLGIILFVLYIAVLTFSKRAIRWFYEVALEDTKLGEAGYFLFLADAEELAEEENRLLATVVSISLLVSINMGVFLLLMLACLVVGGLLFYPVLLLILISPIIYYFVNRKQKIKITTLEAKIEYERSQKKSLNELHDEEM